MSSSVTQSKTPKEDRWTEWQIPQTGISPLTGIEGTSNWGSTNQPDINSRWTIGDSDLDDAINIMPLVGQQKMAPNFGTSVATLASTEIWGFSAVLNGSVNMYWLCQNGHIYQVTVSGVITDLGGGFSSTCDICEWQSTNIIISDPVASKVYNWNGSTLTTVFTAQPATYITVYGGRLWMGFGLTVTFTAGGTFNSLGGDAGSFIVTDSSAANPFLALVSFSGSLYFFGPNYIASLNNLASLGTPAIVSFNFTILEGTIGIINKWSIVNIGTTLYFANAYGIWQFNGAQPSKVSRALDGFFQGLDFSRSTFSAAFAEVYGEPLVMWAAYYVDPLGEFTGYTIFAYTIDEQWFRMGFQNYVFMTGIVSSAITNNIPTAWVSDGTHINELFSGPASQVTTGFFGTKIWDFGSKVRFKTFDFIAINCIITGPTTLSVQIKNYDGTNLGPALVDTVNPALGMWANSMIVDGLWINGASTTGMWEGTAVFFFAPFQFNAGFMSRGMGLDITVTGEQVAIQSISVFYEISKRAARGSPQQV